MYDPMHTTTDDYRFDEERFESWMILALYRRQSSIISTIIDVIAVSQVVHLFSIKYIFDMRDAARKRSLRVYRSHLRKSEP